MERLNSKKLLVVILFVVAFNFSCPGDVSQSDPNDFFKVGDYRDIEILTPKRGFIGAPSDASGLPPRWGLPKTEKDFDSKYLRITVLQIKKLKNSTRVDFSLDKIDPNQSSYHERNYYA
jgi:hypothetical protein